MSTISDHYLIVGAGPSGLCVAKNLLDLNISFEGYDYASEVGGLWNINNERSSVYESAHLISSKKMTEFKDFPMKDSVADYPSHSELFEYFKDYAQHFDIRKHYTFNVGVENIEKLEDYWKVTLSNNEIKYYKGVIITNGNLSEPNTPSFKGDFSGELLHSKSYKTADIFQDKRVLIIGAGNSGCDIAVDACHRATKVDISVRRGYHFVPKYVLGKPADAMGGKIKFPPKIKQKIDSKILKLFTGDPVRFGFPKPDHKLYESHPIVNSLILYHIGHGDICVKPDISHFENNTVNFKDGQKEDYDMVMLCTGFKLHYPFIDNKYLKWTGSKPDFYLNIFHPELNNLFISGLVEATGIGWEGRNEQAKLIAKFIKHKEQNTPQAQKFIEKKKTHKPDLSGGYNYIKLERMAYYVHKDTYRKAINKAIKSFH